MMKNVIIHIEETKEIGRYWEMNIQNRKKEKKKLWRHHHHHSYRHFLLLPASVDVCCKYDCDVVEDIYTYYIYIYIYHFKCIEEFREEDKEEEKMCESLSTSSRKNELIYQLVKYWEQSLWKRTFCCKRKKGKKKLLWPSGR